MAILSQAYKFVTRPWSMLCSTAVTDPRKRGRSDCNWNIFMENFKCMKCLLSLIKVMISNPSASHSTVDGPTSVDCLFCLQHEYWDQSPSETAQHSLSHHKFHHWQTRSAVSQRHFSCAWGQLMLRVQFKKNRIAGTQDKHFLRWAKVLK